MADIMLHTTCANSITCVSNIFIDDFMKDANGEYVKIYLYLLRCLGRDGTDFSISEVADRLDHTERDVMKALTYWETVGLLHLEYNSQSELSGICLADVSSGSSDFVATIAPVTVETVKVPATPAKPAIAAPTKRSYSPEELDIFASQDEVQDCLFAASTYIGRPLSTKESESVLYWYDSLGMSIDLIEYLIETCLDNGHNSFHYMDTVAMNWATDGIKTIEAAKASARSHSNITYSVMKSLGITGRALVPAEEAYINKWLDEYHFDLEIITKACEKTVLSTNKPSFSYADTILASWQANKVKTLEDIALLDQKHVAKVTTKVSNQTAVKPVAPRTKTNGFNNFTSRSNSSDLDELERSLLKK